MNDTFTQVRDHARETALLGSIEALLNWDERTLMPTAAGDYRADQIAYITGLLHRRRTDPQLGEWLAELNDSPLAEDPHSDAGATIRKLRHEYDKLTRLPPDLVRQIARAAVVGQQEWVAARANNDFAGFAPRLAELVKLKQQQADAIGYDNCRYDALLDEYEPGEKTASVRRVLADLRAELVPLVQAIQGSDRQANVSLLHRSFPIAEQREFGRLAAEAIGFDFESGRIDESAHPFCTEAGPADCRITTRYDAQHFSSAFFGTLHEAGHGIYEQGLREDWYGLPPGMYLSLGIHESQSRLWENMVGRSLGFWEHFFPAAQARFASSLGDVTLNQFYFAINHVAPSLIRVEADEVTYNLHIIIRFELEQDLIEGRLAVADLPAAWNEKYTEYLGVTPPNDAYGVLQDIHWSAGLFGYFPTYSLGNLFAAQFFAAAERDLGPLGEHFAAGRFGDLRNWLNERIHRRGQCWEAADLVADVTGSPLSPQPLLDYLRSKLQSLYQW